MKFVADRHFADPDVAVRKLVKLANAIEPVQYGRIYIEAFVSPNSFPVLRLMKCSFMQAEQIMPLNSFSSASSSSSSWTFSLVVGHVKRNAPIPPLQDLDRRRSPGVPRKPGLVTGTARSQVARYVSTLFSCDEPSLILRKIGNCVRIRSAVQSTGLLHLLRAGLS